MKPATKDALWALGLGCCTAFATWAVSNDFEKLESGQVGSIRVWAPIALLYGLGGVWSALAKWGALLLLGGFSALLLWMGVQGLQGKKS